MKKVIPDEKKIKKIIKDWILKLGKIHEQGYSIDGDYQMKCPSCGHDTIVFHSSKMLWYCINPVCQYVFPEHLTPPTIKRLEDYFKRIEIEKAEQKIEMFLKSE